jgi:hypothetical protein
MPRASGIVVENNFSKGLITEAAGLNFPENACVDTKNCVFQFNGTVTRRQGFDFESDNTTKTINRSNCAIKSYLWKNVSGNGDLSLLVVQVGATLYFYKTNQESLSSGAVASTVTLSPVSGAPAPDVTEAQFADGNGLLFVTHPYCEPMRVEFDVSSDTASATNIIIKIRDFEGDSADTLDIADRPTATLSGLAVAHKYNLYNQGWTTANLTTWDTAQTTMPSNADVMWRFKNSSDNFSAADADIARVVAGNTLAPKGHFILELADQDRDTASGLSGVSSTTTGFQRPSTVAWFAGRVFYSGVNYAGFNSSIYFTQIIERPDQYEACYQVNDPTAEDSFDLLPTDGGVIRIHDAGTIFKLFSVPGGLAVFAANGVWFITGSTGLGFTANDYTVQKITHVPTIGPSSFVDVLGFPCWWNAEGIYILTGDGGNLPKVESMTDLTIKSFYEDIPDASKRYARGFYHNIEKKITWLYRSEETQDITEQYEFDRILNFNVRTGAFYPWTISEGAPKVHAIAVTDSSTGSVSVDDVVDSNADNVVDSNGNNIVIFTTGGAVQAPKDKFLVSYETGGSYAFTFAETNNADYIDWFQYDLLGEDYDSYFISGYKLRGEGLRKFQSNWVRIFSDTSADVSYNFQAVWDYSLTGNTGRWSSSQRVEHTDQDYSYGARRLKVRGHGRTLQFKVSSVSGKPFHIIGWSSLDTANQMP